MTITIEEMRKVDIAFEYVSDSAILKLARFVAERQRAVEPTEEMTEAGVYAQEPNQNNSGGSNNSNRLRRRSVRVYRAMSAVAPLVVPE